MPIPQRLSPARLLRALVRVVAVESGGSEHESGDGVVDERTGRESGRESRTESPIELGDDAAHLRRLRGCSKREIAIRGGVLPEEFVLELVEAAGGQVRQKHLVGFTGWSPSAVSRLLIEMESNDRVVRVQIGSGKVVYLPDEVPDGARHPFESPGDTGPGERPEEGTAAQ